MYNEDLNEMKEFFGAMLGLWWFIFFVDWFYLLFRYYFDIKPYKK